jgi:hypothetical protein
MMIPGLLAGAGTVNAENAIRALIPSGSTVSEALVYCGALFVVALAAFSWAIFRTKSRRRRSHHHHHSRPSDQSRHHDEHRFSNPTLAETGGLPPIRVSKSAPPSA